MLITQFFFRFIMIDHAEVVVHDTFGDSLYWKCRRSMRFSKHLFDEANSFRSAFLNSNDTADITVRPKIWEEEKVVTFFISYKTNVSP